MHVDVTDGKSVQEMVDTAVKEFGRIDYYVHSAGIGTSTPSPLGTTPLSEFGHIIHTNMRGTLLCNRAIASAMLLPRPLHHALPRPRQHCESRLREFRRRLPRENILYHRQTRRCGDYEIRRRVTFSYIHNVYCS
ncbi:hypothetical protein BCIN_05g04020 [Botrytis cinerea B05.10]|uniref:Uncharacterized protein n=1 Tax=Botryotinia fuckeliana (strain B05.10) TaxID=332648 RepID=A0A384JHU5_BOTFB|nr:hypothetical protein BCIN_05g04020 [Botrytis cinerea B05.10]ATZ50012.1 hypothetical protein BCIN_05g04020 [Botrytis cinerea B05.10]